MQTQSVGKRYGRGPWVLEDVTVHVPAGEIVAFHGRNGSGKSTLLRLLAGLSRPSRGTVTGRPAVVGYVPDRFRPPERLTALGYLTHLGRIRGLTTPDARRRARVLIDRLAVAGGPHAELRTLSKGNAQKVALSQALLVQPELLVLDEPWSGLDTSAHGVLAEVMAEVAAAGGSVVFTGHGESARTAVAGRAHLVAGGRLHPYGHESPREQRQVTELVLQRPGAPSELPASGDSSRVPPPPPWSRSPGVLTVTDHGADLVLAVVCAEADAVLLAALRDGWSALSVTRRTAPATTAPAPGPPSPPATTAAPERRTDRPAGASRAPAPPSRREGGRR
ncbi:ATP-binding cassette domain-containing protein [Streptomyces triticagri]|uniref:ATP-binding cassette domain-containing protein n=1 Tax=Streptomyces triticagri TaxID=2293568 RepID=A0A372LU91_9ACTN|nr:ABC transporter ATP-binding protein [Streptomyces triticagri]RFU82238.1 ATP-binding cassette domain-containing protein [Streptomyces triticagri]